MPGQFIPSTNTLNLSPIHSLLLLIKYGTLSSVCQREWVLFPVIGGGINHGHHIAAVDDKPFLGGGQHHICCQ